MISLKNYVKKLGTNDNGAEYSRSNKLFWKFFYMEYFQKLITNFFEYENLPQSLDPIFIEKKLSTNGFVGFFDDKKLGLVVQSGVMSGGLNLYDQPLKFNTVNNKLFGNKPKDILWYSDNEFDENKDKVVIVGNDNFYQSSFDWVEGFCEKLADIEQTIQLNRNAQIMPYVALSNDNEKISFKNIYNKIMDHEPIIYLKAKKNKSGLLEDDQIDSRFKIFNLNTPFLLDKLHDEKQRVINQLLTIIGINNIAIDKNERLTKSESTSNNGLINASIEIRLKSRELGFDLVNDYFGENIKVYPSKRIENFNTEQVFDDLNNLKGGEEYI